jgi:hypothetical protein
MSIVKQQLDELEYKGPMSSKFFYEGMNARRAGEICNPYDEFETGWRVDEWQRGYELMNTLVYDEDE